MTLEARARLARRVVIGLQLIPIGLVAIALGAVVWTILAGGQRETGRGTGSSVSLAAVAYVPVLAGLLAAGVVGLRRWAAGGSATLLYGFDALPVLFLLFTAGPAALHDTRGLLLAAAFVVPGAVAWSVAARGEPAR